jgi:hypothetical protein
MGPPTPRAWAIYQHTGERRELRRRIRLLRREREPILRQYARKAPRYKRTRGTARNLLKVWPTLWTFAERRGVEPTMGTCKNRLRPSPGRIKAMSFFEPTPPPPEPPHFGRRPPQPAWQGPPDGVLGGVVALELLLARSEKAVVLIDSATAYPTGVEFTVDVRWHGEPPDRIWQGLSPKPHRRWTGELPDELLRLGVQFADGSKATTLDSGPAERLAAAYARPVEDFGGEGAVGGSGEGHEAPEMTEGPAEMTEGPVLLEQRAGGGGHRWSQSLWLWPLPPKGPLSFVCEWPALGIALSRAEIDAALLHEAAARSRTVWDDGSAASPPSASAGPS